MGAIGKKERSNFAEIKKQLAATANQLNRARAELEAMVDEAKENVRKSREFIRKLKKAEKENQKFY